MDGYAFDTGPTVLTMPELIAEALAAVGEELTDWLTLDPVEPAYRAFYPDGSTLDVHTDTARMAAAVAELCGPREADGYLRFVDYARQLWQWQRHDFIDRNLDSPRDLLTANLLRLLAHGAFRSLQTKIEQFFRDPRTQRIFSFQAMYAGLAPHDALALYTVIAYLDSVAGVYFPRGGIHAVPRALAGAAEKHGVTLRYGVEVTQVTTSAGRATGVRTRPASTSRPTWWSSTRTCRSPTATCCRPDAPGRLRYSPSAVVLHAGSTRRVRAHRAPQHPLWNRLAAHLPRDHRRGPADDRPVAAAHQPDPG